MAQTSRLTSSFAPFNKFTGDVLGPMLDSCNLRLKSKENAFRMKLDCVRTKCPLVDVSLIELTRSLVIQVGIKDEVLFI